MGSEKPPARDSASCAVCHVSLENWSSPEGLCANCLLRLGLQVGLEEREDETVSVRHSETASLARGHVLGRRYRLGTFLGRGGMGEVWQAFDLKLRVDVALKSVLPERFSVEGHDTLEPLRREVRTAHAVISPNVCRIYDLVELDGREFVSMEYIDGETLIEVLRSEGALELRRATEIASQFLAGLEAIHNAGLIHRDLKPENVMITRAGRVVVMDFGLAKPDTSERSGTIAGTPGYMPPEQLAGDPLDARTDIFAAGVVLAEMISGGVVSDRESRRDLQRRIHLDPPQLPDSPWQSVLRRAVSRHPDARYASARELTRALEEITLRVEGAEDVCPYPGLAAFHENDAEYFFGREVEVETVWKKLRQSQLLGLIGPSGAGKSSFLGAGLLPAIPAGWRAVIATPGNRPFRNLAQCLVPELSGDTEAVGALLRFEEEDVAISLVAGWRRRSEQALIVIDQFEELFTLNPPDVQRAFAELLSRLALDADVHVLLSMRDDFLFHCSEQPALGPVFSELTPLRAPTGAALRRAIVQPALKCGYRFEDERLVDEILAEVEDERGALPMVAFAAAQWWVLRDRDEGQMSRAAYEQIGGVSGALAQHAESLLDEIGSTRIPVVRELFRNLITSQGTRAARDREELLSVFEEQDRHAAAEVLDKLIASRLLTSYELPAAEDGTSAHPRVEIIHESLLSAWPRLVRWQTQDADGAQLRDQLRQAAQGWDARDRPDDLLWTGTPFREFQLWSESYPGNLSATELAFAEAMRSHAQRQRRRRRIALTAGFGLLIVVLGIISLLWRQSENSRRQAVFEARRAEAARLRSLAELELDRHPTGTVAFAIASLELHDSPEVRRLAIDALWRGPTGLRFDAEEVATVEFTADGKWLVGVKNDFAGARVWPAVGGPGSDVVLGEEFEGWHDVISGPQPDGMISFVPSGDAPHMRIWSVSNPERFSGMEVGFALYPFLVDRGQRLLTLENRTDRFVMREWPLEGGEPRRLGQLDIPVLGMSPYFTLLADVDPSGRWVAYAVDRELYLAPLLGLGTAPPRLLGHHSGPISTVAFAPSGERVGSATRSGEIRVWTIAEGGGTGTITLEGRPDSFVHRFDSSGSMLVRNTQDPVTELWDLTAPPGADPIELRRAVGVGQINDVAFLPGGRWVATVDAKGGFVWPLSRSYPRVLKGHENVISGLGFAPDGSCLISSSLDQTVRRWPLSSTTGEQPAVLYRTRTAEWDHAIGVGISSDASYVVGGFATDTVRVIPMDGTAPREFVLDPHLPAFPVADPTARFAMWIEESTVRALDVESGAIHDVAPSSETGYVFVRLASTEDGTVLFTHDGNLWAWDRTTRKVERWVEQTPQASVYDLAVTADGRHLLTCGGEGRTCGGEYAVYHDLATGDAVTLESHDNQVVDVALDPTGRIAVTGASDGTVRVGPVTGETPHLLLGHEGSTDNVAVSPDGRWIASGGHDGTIRLWPMPEGTPLQTLTHDEFLDRLRSLTNLRAVADGSSSIGYRIDADPFPGWEDLPTW